MSNSDVKHLTRQVQDLEQENARLRAALIQDRQSAPVFDELRYRTLFDSIDEGFCIIEFFDGPHGPLSDYIHIEANAAYARHTGIPDVVGRNVREMVPSEADGWVELYRQVLLTGNPIRFERELVATGRYLELAAFRVEPASRAQVAVLFQDITPRRRAEQALQQLNGTLESRVAAALAERKVLADIVEGTNAFIQVVDRDYRLIAINGAAKREFHRLFDVEPVVGDNILSLLEGDRELRDGIRANWARAFRGEEFVETTGLTDADGLLHHYEMHFNPLRDACGTCIGAYQFAYDISARIREQEQLKSAEEALRHSQKMDAIGQLTGGIAHDFNNMLAVIISSLRLTKRRIERGEGNVEEMIDSGIRSAERAASLVKRLLAFSRQQPLSPQHIDVASLLRGIEEVFRRTIPENIAITIDVGDDVGAIHADPQGLENALLNLVVNARDAMPAGGNLTISVANAPAGDAHLASAAPASTGECVVITVTDTGIGMTPDILSRAADPFFTTKAVGKGTGLGLSLVYGFVNQSGGHLNISSEKGCGTTVSLFFPRDRTASTNVAHKAPAADVPAGAGQLILVVEDEDEVRRLTVDCLKELGYTALSASCASEAMDLLERHPNVSMLLTDVVMPGVNGRTLAAMAAKLRPGLKVLFTTGYDRNALVHDGTLEEGIELIMKPYSVEALGTKVAQCLETA